MNPIIRNIFTPVARPVPGPKAGSAQEAINDPQGTPLPIRSPAGNVGARLRAAFSGCAARLARAVRRDGPSEALASRTVGAHRDGPPSKPLASRTVQSGWQAGARSIGPRRELAMMTPSRPAPKMTLEDAMTQLGASPVDLKAPAEHAVPVTPLAFTLSAQRDELPSDDRLEDLEPELFSTLSDQASLDHEVRPSKLYPGMVASVTPYFDAMFDDIEAAETDTALTGATAPARDALLGALTSDDGEGLSEGAARAVIARMSTGASREDALDALRDGQLGVPEYATHAPTGIAGGWGADD